MASIISSSARPSLSLLFFFLFGGEREGLEARLARDWLVRDYLTTVYFRECTWGGGGGGGGRGAWGPVVSCPAPR